MASVGSILRREREKKRVQVADVASATKIPERYLRAIEKDDYSVFPAETYLIGFIRNYARELDLDANEMVSIYKNNRLEKDRNRHATAYAVQETAERPAAAKPELRRPVKSVEPPPPPVAAPTRQVLKEKKPVAGSPVTSGPSFADFWRERAADLARFFSFLMRNPIPGLIAVGSVLLIVLLVFVLVGVRKWGPGRTSGRDAYAKVQIVQFEQDTGIFDLNLNEYYRLRLGRDLYALMGEMLNPTGGADSAVKLLLHLDRSQYELTPGLKKDLDLNVDGELDISLKLNSISESSYNLAIYKLRAFTTNQTVESGTNMVPSKPSSAKPQNEAFTAVGTKKKIIFHAEVVQKTYVKAWLDSSEQEAKVYYPGQTFEFTAQDAIQLRIGNPGGLKVTVNGVAVKLGSQGVVNKTIKWKRDLFDENVYNLVIVDWQ
jgi:cytoskeletal protein RodZ